MIHFQKMAHTPIIYDISLRNHSVEHNNWISVSIVYLLCDGVVHGLGDLVAEPHDVLIAPAALVEVIGLP